MTLIDMNMPQNCQECPAFATKACDKWDKHKTFQDQRTKRHNDCPLKSIDGLIKRLKDLEESCASDSYGKAMAHAMDTAIKEVKEYCGGELE